MFCKLEDTSAEITHTKNEQMALDHFGRTCMRQEDVVELPRKLIPSHSAAGDQLSDDISRTRSPSLGGASGQSLLGLSTTTPSEDTQKSSIC